MNTNIKALSNEELEVISGGGDALKIANRIILTVIGAAAIFGAGKFASDVYKDCNDGYGFDDIKKGFKKGRTLYGDIVHATANLFREKKK